VNRHQNISVFLESPYSTEGLRKLIDPARKVARMYKRVELFSLSARSRSDARSDALTNQSGLVTLTFDLLTLKVVSESHMTWATSMRILVFLGFSVLELRSMYATDRQTSDRSQTSDKNIA